MIILFSMLVFVSSWEAFAPYPADVIRVIDGDTFVAKVHLRKGLAEDTRIRLHGVDTPEMTSCPEAAIKAKEFLTELIGSKVRVKFVVRDSFGRMVSHVFTLDGDNVGAVLLEAGMAEKYPADDNVCPDL